MKRRSYSSILLVMVLMVALVSGTPAFAKKAKKRGVDKLKFPPINPIKLPTIQKAETANGAKLRLIKDDKLPLVNLRIFLKGGGAYLNSSLTGLDAATAQLLRIGGTKGMKPDEVDKLLDANGITINFGSDTDSYAVTLSCLKENFDQALSILAKMMREPAFDKDKLEEIKTGMSGQISRRNDTPGPIRNREFNKLIYGADSPFAAQLEYEHVDKINRRDINTVYKSYFAPDNMLVGVIGPLEMNEFKGMFEKYFGSWKHKAAIPHFPKVKEQKADFKIAFAEKSNLNQSYLSIGHLGEISDLKERAKILLFNSIFTQGFSSRLVVRVRVKMGLTYGIGGGIVTEYLYPGKTFFSTFTKSESTIDAIKAIFDEIDIIRKEKVTAKELEDARNFYLNAHVFRFSSPSAILRSSLMKEFYGIPANADEVLLEDIKKVTADDILEVAQKYMHPDKMVVFVVGNEKQIKGKLSDLGKVKKIDISIKPPALKEKIPPATPETLAKGKALIDQMAAKAYKGFKTIKSSKTIANMKMKRGPQTMDLALDISSLYPDKIHMGIKVMGFQIKRVINGNKGFTDQMGNKKPMSEEEIYNEFFADIYDLFHAKDKYKFQYLKEEKIDGKTYDVVYIFDAKKNWKKFFINRANGYVEIEESVSKAPGQTGIQRSIRSDFKLIKGLPYAFKTETFINGKSIMQVTLSEVQVNPKLDKSLFKVD